MKTPFLCASLFHSKCSHSFSFVTKNMQLLLCYTVYVLLCYTVYVLLCYTVYVLLCYTVYESCPARPVLHNSEYLSRSTNYELHILKFSPNFCYCLPLRYKCFRQHLHSPIPSIPYNLSPFWYSLIFQMTYSIVKLKINESQELQM
jgi:hypothetical protein